MDFESVFRLLLENFKKYRINAALIGGFALHVGGYSRATEDIDFLVAREDMPKVKKLLFSFGYQLLHESEDVSNFAGGLKELGRVDFLHAHRSYAKAMLERAPETDILNGQFKVKVITPEDLIGLKVQSSSNDAGRYHLDMADIEEMIRSNYKNLKLDLIEEYFKLFHREAELKKILERVRKDAQ